MTIAEPSDLRLIEAKLAFARYQDELLSKGPLADMGEWIRQGVAPASAVLRAKGLTTEGLSSASKEAALLVHELKTSREAFVRKWGFSIPCSEAVDSLRDLDPLVEVGAGTGYWSALLRAAGLDIVATDLNPVGRNSYRFESGSVASIEGLSAAEAVRKYAERDVFCSWPSENESWALVAAWAMRRGRRFAAILNPGNTATRGLRRYLATRFRKVSTVVIPQFPGVADDLIIYEKI